MANIQIDTRSPVIRVLTTDFVTPDYSSYPVGATLEAYALQPALLSSLQSVLATEVVKTLSVNTENPHGLVFLGLGVISPPQENEVQAYALLPASMATSNVAPTLSTGLQGFLPLGFEGLAFSETLSAFPLQSEVGTLEITTYSYLTSEMTIQAIEYSYLSSELVPVVEDMSFDLESEVGTFGTEGESFALFRMSEVLPAQYSYISNELTIETTSAYSEIDNEVAPVESEAYGSELQSEVNVISEAVSVITTEMPPIAKQGLSYLSASIGDMATSTFSIFESEVPVVTEDLSTDLESEVFKVVFEGTSYISAEAPVVTESRSFFVQNELVLAKHSNADYPLRNAVYPVNEVVLTLSNTMVVVEDFEVYNNEGNFLRNELRVTTSETSFLGDTPTLFGKEFESGVLDDPLYTEYVTGILY